MGDYDGEYEVYFQVKFSGANEQEPVTKKGCYTVDGGEVDSEEEAEEELEDFYANNGEDKLVDISDLDIHNLGDTELEILETKFIPTKRFMGHDYYKTEPLTVDEEIDHFIKNKGDGSF